MYKLFQNAEMAFNFGDKPFKYDLPEGFAPINTAPKESIVQNTAGQATSAASVKPSNNAPQAIIIEVCIFNHTFFLFFLEFHNIIYK